MPSENKYFYGKLPIASGTIPQKMTIWEYYPRLKKMEKEGEKVIIRCDRELDKKK